MKVTSLSHEKNILAFDSDCGPCKRFSRIVDFLDRHERIDFMPLAIADNKGLLDKIPEHLRYKSFHLILPDGEVKSATEGVLQLIAILPMGSIISPIVNHFPGGKRLVRFIYNQAAKLRKNGSCSIDGNRK